MFKYVVHVKLKDSKRGASVTIKTEADWDVKNKMEALGFLGAHNVLASMTKMFGEGNVLELTVAEKTQVLSQS